MGGGLEGLGFVVLVSVFKPVVKGKQSGPITDVSPTSLTDCAPCNPQSPGDWLFSVVYIIKWSPVSPVAHCTLGWAFFPPSYGNSHGSLLPVYFCSVSAMSTVVPQWNFPSSSVSLYHLETGVCENRVTSGLALLSQFHTSFSRWSSQPCVWSLGDARAVECENCWGSCCCFNITPSGYWEIPTGVNSVGPGRFSLGRSEEHCVQFCRDFLALSWWFVVVSIVWSQLRSHSEHGSVTHGTFYHSTNFQEMSGVFSKCGQ